MHPYLSSRKEKGEECTRKREREGAFDTFLIYYELHEGCKTS